MKNTLKAAFAVQATGEHDQAYRANLVQALGQYAPDVPIVDVDPAACATILGTANDKTQTQTLYRRLAVPLLDTFKDYDRVIWIDADTDITAAQFADILTVETSADGLSAVPEIPADAHTDDSEKPQIRYDASVLVFDLCKIKRTTWKARLTKGLKAHQKQPFAQGEQDVLNQLFAIQPLDARFNWNWAHGVDPQNGAWLIHYATERGHAALDEILALRDEFGGTAKAWQERCVVVSPRHAFIRPWIRAYFATGNTTPLVLVPGPPGDWTDDDMEYCTAAAQFTGGCILDCSSEWRDSERLAERAVLSNRVGWFTKKSILHAVATRLTPKAWAWIDDDAEVTGNLDECFTAAERAPGFIFAQFYYPNSIDTRHPERMYRSNIDTGDKICWNSLIFFHGEANDRMAEELGKDFPVEDDEIVFGYLYQHNPVWHDGFCDFSIRNWQKNCKLLNQIPRNWSGKLLHYTSYRAGGEVKKMWANKVDRLPPAPFEKQSNDERKKESDGPIDAVFVIGTGSIGGNEELRYALRNLAAHCPFVRDVYICGYCPPWVDRTVVKHLNWPDRFTHAKDANIIDKLRHACEQPGIAKRILFCSDDQFQTRSCTWEDFAPRYLRRYASNDGWYEGRHRVWHTRLRKTLEREVQRRQKCGLNASDVFYYQPHIWMPIDRDLFVDYARWCGYAQRDDTIIASGYYNFVGASGRPDFDHVFIGNDVKKLPTATHIAYHDGSYAAAMRLLKGLFPQPCRFERADATDQMMARASARPAQPTIPPPTTPSLAAQSREDDPSPARPDEAASIHALTARVRDNPTWHALLGEISRAEELRLFGVRGWRTVWNDIQARWRAETCNGTDNAPVTQPRSDAARAVVNAYIQNPNSLRTVRFGPQTPDEPTKVWVQGRQLVRPAAPEAREALRARIRAFAGSGGFMLK